MVGMALIWGEAPFSPVFDEEKVFFKKDACEIYQILIKLSI